MFMTDANQENYKKLKKQYDEYVDLYKFFNHGSTDGVTPFAEFYWRFTYYIRYEEPALVGVKNK